MLSPLQIAIAGAALLAATTSAHFSLQHPTGLGKSTNSQADGPCGGYTPSFEKTSEFYVGGEAVAFSTSHPQAHILIRGTLDPTAGSNWTNLHPVIRQDGVGSLCVPQIGAPEDWAGQQGIIQVIQSGEDGMLFACAAVSFQAEISRTVTTLCSNGTGVKGEFSSDARLPSDGTGFSMDMMPQDSDEETSTKSEGEAKTSTTAPAEPTSMGSKLGPYYNIFGAAGACIISAALSS